MEKNWVKIYTSSNFYESEIVKQVLTGYQIDAVLLNRQASSHQAFGDIEVYIHQENFGRAIEIMILSGALLFSGAALLNYSDMFALPALNGHQLAYLLLFLFVLSVSLVFIRELFKISVAPFANIAYTLVGMAFVIIPFSFFHALAYINKQGFNFHIPMAFLLMLWANDTGAYLVGLTIGRTKLFERHSPKKTWEGFIGGVVISAGVGYIISLYFPELDWKQWMSVGILISCFGTLGDLVESMFKRSINVKDSGSILPGHGGLLDRFDGLLLAAPIVYTYLYFVVNA
jgi:phosphatidate cytidylyltransferase